MKVRITVVDVQRIPHATRIFGYYERADGLRERIDVTVCDSDAFRVNAIAHYFGIDIRSNYAALLDHTHEYDDTDRA